MKNQVAKNISEKEVLTGVIVPVKWDDNFEITSVLLSCKGERDIAIANLERFPNLLRLSQQEAVVTGTVHRNGTNEYIHIETIISPEGLSQ